MSTYLLFTHTEWTEAPRLRHQVAQLLLDAGHEVYFFEREAGAFSDADARPVRVANGPALVRGRALIHHQLRLLPPLHWANSRVVGGQIRRFLKQQPIPHDAVIVNFNYDYYFLRTLFPDNKIITIINDDFEGMSRLPFHHHITWALRKTCKMSDAVYAVSTPLLERLKNWCEPKLFLPWSVTTYQAPNPDVAARKSFLFWGYVDTRLDLDLLGRLAQHLGKAGPDWKILVVGPTQGKARPIVVDALAPYPNVEILGRSTLEDLPLDSVLGALITYRREKANDATLQTNKTMQLLAKGLPLLISGMPAFIRKPFILRLDGEEDFAAVIDACARNFNAWQPQIRQFVDENSPASRMAILGVEPQAAGAATTSVRAKRL